MPYLEPDEEAWREHRAALEAHLPFRDFELARPTPDGGERYVSVSGVPVFDETRRVMGYRGVGRHITDRKRSEKALLQSQAYLAEAQRLTQTGSGAYDPVARRLIYWSDETFRIFGFDPRPGSLPAPCCGTASAAGPVRMCSVSRNAFQEARPSVLRPPSDTSWRTGSA